MIVGLGNPESKYNWTRHNTGFLMLDFYFKVHGAKWNSKPRLGAKYGRMDDVIYIKPQDYYNLSGQVVREYMRYYKIATSDVLVICDDFNLDFGRLRYRSSGSAGGNNGLRSIILALETEDFARLRIGTGNNEIRAQMGDVDFVLSKFTSGEKAQLPAILKEACEKVDFWIKM